MRSVSEAGRLSPSARLNLAGSQFANKRGLYLGKRSTKIHVRLYRWTKGRVGGHLPGFPNVPIVLVDHVGARSGRQRTSPLMYDEHDGVVAVAASKAGEPTHPAWYHNLLAHPETTIQTGAHVRKVRARVAAESERAQWWPRLVAKYPGYEFYQRRANHRQIPIVLFEPAE